MWGVRAGVVAVVVMALLLGWFVFGRDRDDPPGVTRRVGSFDVTVFGIDDPIVSANRFDEPRPGDRFVGVDVEVANWTSTARVYGAAQEFHLIDADGDEYQEDEANAGLANVAPDGDIAADSDERGLVVFEVPKDAKVARFVANGDLATMLDPHPPAATWLLT